MNKMAKKIFTTSGSWTAPSGVTSVILIGYGGGGGGGSGSLNFGYFYGGAGGGAAMQGFFIVDVVPNTSYTVTIGAGGTGGAIDGNSGTNGGTTTFGALATFIGGAKGDVSSNVAFGGMPIVSETISSLSAIPVPMMLTQSGASSRNAYAHGTVNNWAQYWCTAGGASPQGYTGGASGGNSGSYNGGGGGGAGTGVGGAGSNANNAGSTSAGTAGAANTGSGGGGSGSASATSTGVGGAGGSGKLTIYYVEG